MSRDKLRNWERAGQRHTNSMWSSGPEPHSLQVGSRLVESRNIPLPVYESFHASLLQLLLRMEYSDGRLFFKISSFRVGMMPLEGVLEIRDARTWRGSELEVRTEKE